MDNDTKNKLKLLGLDDNKDIFSKIQIDVLYEKYIEKNRYVDILFFLNAILQELKMPNISNIFDFKVSRADIIKIDGIKFYNKYKDNFDNLNINKYDHLQYNSSKKVNVYILTILKGLCKFYGLKFVNSRTSNIINSKKINIIYYSIDKNE